MQSLSTPIQGPVDISSKRTSALKAPRHQVETQECIKVFVRIRPLHPNETSGALHCVEAENRLLLCRSDRQDTAYNTPIKQREYAVDKVWVSYVGL